MVQTATDPLKALQAWVDRFPTRQAAAKAFGVSAAYLGQLLNGTRACSESVLNRLGLERVVTIHKKRVSS